MINVEAAVTAKFPQLAATPALLKKPAFNLLRHLVHEEEINAFLTDNADVSDFEWIDRVFEHLNFSYTASARDRMNIPSSGRVVIIANHPIGSLDGLGLLRFIGEIRRDVKIIANDLLSHISALQNLLIPIDNMGNSSAVRGYRQVLAALEQEQAIILFPSGEVSRASPLGVRDTQWRPGFLNFARKSGAPLLPILVKARNSWLFYGASMLYRPFSTALLSDEMFKHQRKVVRFHVGDMIPVQKLVSDKMQDRNLVKRLRKHLYKLDRSDKVNFETERAIAHPEDRQALQQELKQGQLLGLTRDNIAIILFDWRPDSTVIREIGRLRELTFRKVGEGTGKRRDLDSFDVHYRHLVLWDKEALEIAGAYRLGEGAAIIASLGERGLYTNSLYDYSPEFLPYIQHGIELGRSFVSPQYWGKHSLDYLWQGIGAYLATRPDIHYLFGPVSMSASYPRELAEELVFYFSKYYSAEQTLATAHRPFTAPIANTSKLAVKYAGLDRDEGFDLLQASFALVNQKIPVLYRQYEALFAPGGFQTLQFSIDPDFADCIDGLCLADLRLLKPNKRERYLSTRRQQGLV